MNVACWGNLLFIASYKPAHDNDYGMLTLLVLSPPFVLLETLVSAIWIRGTDLSGITDRRIRILYAVELIGLVPFALFFLYLFIADTL